MSYEPTSFAEVCDLFAFRASRLTFILDMMSKRYPLIKHANALLNAAKQLHDQYYANYQQGNLSAEAYAKVVPRLTQPITLMYQLMSFNQDPTAQQELLAESRLTNHPLQAFISPLLKVLKIR